MLCGSRFLMVVIRWLAFVVVCWMSVLSFVVCCLLFVVCCLSCVLCALVVVLACWSLFVICCSCCLFDDFFGRCFQFVCYVLLLVG